MAIPEKIPIARIEDYHTHYLGKCSDGRQFWGYETFVFTKPYPSIQGEDWEKYRREYVVLHFFDGEGNYLATNHWFAGITAECDQQLMSERLEAMVAQLGEVTYGDIAIKPFQTLIDGFTFGLVINEANEVVDLEPSSTISFGEPWDGEYDT